MTRGMLLWVLWSGAALAKGGGRCVVEGKKIDPVTLDVAPKEAAPFKVRAAAVPAAATPQPAGQPARVEVRAPLAFEGTAAPDQVPWKTAREVQAMSGMLRLPRATDLVLYATAFARIVDAEVKLGPVHIRGFTLPCKDLTLDAVEQAPATETSGDSGASFVAAVKQLHFHHEAGSGPQLEVLLGDDLTALELRRIESSGAWTRVSSHWADGTTLVGWVKREELKPAPPRHEQLGEPFLPASSCTREVPPARPGERVSSAKVTVGTPVHAARYVGPWATVKTADPVTVRWRPKDDWVAIVSVPGLASAGECPEHSLVLDDAWVTRQAVQLPSEATPSPPP
jgi:hypothetical protein